MDDFILLTNSEISINTEKYAKNYNFQWKNTNKHQGIRDLTRNTYVLVPP